MAGVCLFLAVPWPFSSTLLYLERICYEGYDDYHLNPFNSWWIIWVIPSSTRLNYSSFILARLWSKAINELLLEPLVCSHLNGLLFLFWNWTLQDAFQLFLRWHEFYLHDQLAKSMIDLKQLRSSTYKNVSLGLKHVKLNLWRHAWLWRPNHLHSEFSWNLKLAKASGSNKTSCAEL